MLMRVAESDTEVVAPVEPMKLRLEVIPITEGVCVINPATAPGVVLKECDPQNLKGIAKRIMRFPLAHGVLIDDWANPAHSLHALPKMLREREFRGKIGLIAAPFPKFSPARFSYRTFSEDWRWYMNRRKCLPYTALRDFVHHHLAADGLAFHSLADAQWFFKILRKPGKEDWSRAFLYDWTGVATAHDGRALAWRNSLPHHSLLAGVYDFHFRKRSTTQLPAEDFLRALFL